MSDERFEEFLQREAKAYNAPPPEVPREEMWAVVAAARAARPAPAAAPVIRPLHQHPKGIRYTAWMGMAATLLVGIGIGRFALERGSGVPAPPVVAAVDTSAVRSDVADTPDPRAISRDVAPPAAAPASARPSADARPSATRLAAASGGTRPSGTTDGGTNGVASGNDALDTPYRVASQQHLARAEALVAVVATTPRDAMMDSLTARWAREMLTNTRLLLDSPAGEDPIRRRLLEDLETLLVQLVQRSGAAADERALIDRTLERTQLLTRLRSGAAGT
jgi:hypothetical protein